jgi:long-chain acyl-CoA synthetase
VSKVKKSIAMANVADLLRAPTEQYPDDVAIVDGERELTWTQLSSSVSAAGHGLAALGLFGGHRVALALGNSIEFVTSYLAVLRAGMVAVPLNPTLTPNELGRVLDDCGARAVIADGQTIDSVRHVVAEFAVGGSGGPPVVVTVGADTLEGERSFSDLLGTSGPDVNTPPDPEGLAVLLYTSGTSGRPRAAMLSHRALLANVEQASHVDPPPVEHTDLVLGVLPMFHVYGLNAVLGQSLHAGATLVLGRRFDPDETLDLIQHRRVTCVPVAPPVILAWSRRTDLAERLSGVRTLLSGAAPLDAAAVERFEAAAGLPVEQGYGLTEAAPVVTFTLGTTEHKPGSAGRPVPGVEVRIVDEFGNDELGDPGEIWVRGDNLFSGYWPDRDGGPDADGWLATGDIGYLDPDGDLFLVDRLKELVIVSGFNVYPTEIEDVIVEVDGVLECAVIGAPVDPGGEQVVAIVVPSDPDADADELVARIEAHTTEQLARFKQPAKIEIASELPHSATGKVAKGRLRAAQARRAMGLA